MNVFIIPSWYPSEKNPIAGIFFKEQATYTAELFNNLNVGISLWGQENPDFIINKNIPASLKNFLKYYLGKPLTEATVIKKNLIEISTPSLFWTHKYLSGNIANLIKANLLNLKKFEQQYGKVDIIHAHVSYPAGLIAMTIAKQLNIPYIITEHMNPFPFPSFISGKGSLSELVSVPIKKASKVIAVSPKLQDDINAWGLPRPVYIPNVVDEDFFTVCQPVSSSPFKFFTLARLAPDKGIDELLEAIKIIIKTSTNVSFTIGGGGDMLEYYKEKAHKLQIHEYVNWLGTIDREEAKEQFNKCNAFVLPSHRETFGVVYAEAIACGKPIVATRSGGPECIVDKKNGVLANIKDPKDLSDKMLYMMKEYNTYTPEEIRKSFESRFSKNAVIPKIVNLYKSLL